LQARREVRGLADDRVFLRRPRAQEITDDDETSRNPDAQLQPLGGPDLADLADERESGAHRLLGVILMRLWVTEIGEHAVAHVFRDEAAVSADRLAHRAVIGADDLAQVLGIEARS